MEVKALGGCPGEVCETDGVLDCKQQDSLQTGLHCAFHSGRGSAVQGLTCVGGIDGFAASLAAQQACRADDSLAI